MSVRSARWHRLEFRNEELLLRVSDDRLDVQGFDLTEEAVANRLGGEPDPKLALLLSLEALIKAAAEKDHERALARLLTELDDPSIELTALALARLAVSNNPALRRYAAGQQRTPLPALEYLAQGNKEERAAVSSNPAWKRAHTVAKGL